MVRVNSQDQEEKPKNTRYTVTKEHIFCKGFSETSYHNGVYLAISVDKDYVECPYCDCRFIYDIKKATADND